MHMHAHHDEQETGIKRLGFSIFINIILTIAQIVGGLLSGSLALMADALHNLSDAGSLGIALFARKMSFKPADEFRTFGYKRAETIGALINVTILIVIGFYLIYEAVMRFWSPEPVEGWIVIYVAGVALVIDTITAILTYSISKDSDNIKAAFVHNMIDALGSIVAMAAGALILLYDWYIFDTIATVMIAGYVLYEAVPMLKQSIRLLMASTPEDINIGELTKTLESIEHVENIHHIHVWELDQHRRAFEAHVVIDEDNLLLIEHVKKEIKAKLDEQFSISHSTLEFELKGFYDVEEHQH